MFILVIRREKNDKKRFQFLNIVLNTETNRNIVFGVFSFFFFFPTRHSFSRQDQFTVFILVFKNFTDPGLLEIRLTLTSLSLWFCLHKCF